MILKFILLTSFCINVNNQVICGEYLRDNIINATDCKNLANAIGKAKKRKFKELGGYMVEYRAHCIAINKEGYEELK